VWFLESGREKKRKRANRTEKEEISGILSGERGEIEKRNKKEDRLSHGF